MLVLKNYHDNQTILPIAMSNVQNYAYKHASFSRIIVLLTLYNITSVNHLSISSALVNIGATIGFSSIYYTVLSRMPNIMLNCAILEGDIGTSITLSVSTRDVISTGESWKMCMVMQFFSLKHAQII